MKKKNVFFIRSHYYKYDSRLIKYIGFLDGSVNYSVISWGRSGELSSNSAEFTYSRKCTIGGGWRNIFSFILWNIYVCHTLYRNRKHIDIVHCVDLDCGFFVYLLSKLLKFRYIYDCYDVYSDSRGIKGIGKKIIDYLERVVCQGAYKCIFPDEARLKQLQLKSTSNHIVIFENVPDFNEKPAERTKNINNRFRLAYVGILESTHRGLEDLLVSVSTHPECTLDIAGDGLLKQKCMNFSEKYENINYYGPVNKERAYSIMAEADVLIGMYYLTNANHHYASPNKYYEHLFFGKPLLTTNHTPPGDKVIKYNTGYAISEGVAAISEFLDSLNEIDLNNKSENAKKQWENNYSTYIQHFKLKYIQLINS